MPAKKTASGSSSSASATKSRSRVTKALRKATGVVAKATGRGDDSSRAATKKSASETAAKTAKKAPAKKTAPAKKSAAKAPAKKAPAKKTSAKKVAPAKKTTAKKTTAKNSPAKKSVAAKAAAKKSTPAKKAGPPTKQTATTRTPVAKKTSAAPSKTHQTTAAAKKAAPTKKAATDTTTKKTATPRKLRVRDDESPWTPKELATVRAELEGDVQRLTAELDGFESEIAGLIKDSGDGAGDDQADTGAKTFEREHEYSLAQNSRDLLEQSVHALERINDGTYGVCENCGNAIGKLRLQAFPRATLCLTCKAKQERR